MRRGEGPRPRGSMIGTSTRAGGLRWAFWQPGCCSRRSRGRDRVGRRPGPHLGRARQPVPDHSTSRPASFEILSRGDADRVSAEKNGLCRLYLHPTSGEGDRAHEANRELRTRAKHLSTTPKSARRAPKLATREPSKGQLERLTPNNHELRAGALWPYWIAGASSSLLNGLARSCAQLPRHTPRKGCMRGLLLFRVYLVALLWPSDSGLAYYYIQTQNAPFFPLA